MAGLLEVVGGSGTRASPYEFSREPVLWGSHGEPLSLAGAMVAPAALNVAQVYQLAGKAFSYRWDEAMRDAPENAKAMRRDAFYRSLIQERTAPTVNAEFEVAAPDEADPVQVLQRDVMQRAWDEFPQKVDLLEWLLYGHLWYGRVAQQGVWGTSPSGLTNWLQHEPVNGDSVQFQYDGTPFVLVNYLTAQKYRAIDPAAVIPGTDRGAYGLRLYKPEYRKRFVILKHLREAADYYEGEMSGGVHGVGIRSWVYWNDFVRRETMAGMLGFMNSFGMMDALVFNYPWGNAEAEARAISNSKKTDGKLVLVCPRDPSKDWPAVEQIAMNAAGVEVMMKWLDEYADRHIRELIVGQVMSTGSKQSGGGLEGDGRADFARDTKDQLCEKDARRVCEALTTDWLVPGRDYNFPGSSVGLRMRVKRADPKAKEKVENAKTAWEMGVAIEEEEVREAMGFRKPRSGQKVLAPKPAPDPMGLGGSPVPGGDEGGRAAGDRKPASEFFSRLGAIEDRIAVLCGTLAGISTYRATSPPWPGAVFDESTHRWRNPDGTDTPPDRGGGSGGGGRAATSFGDDHDVALKPDVAAAVVQGIEADVAAMPEGSRPPESLVARAKDVALTVAAKAYAWSLHASHSKSVAYLATILGEVFDTPADMRKLGYNPTASSGIDKASNDFVRQGLADATGVGISGHLVASISARVLVKAAGWVKAKLTKKPDSGALYAAEEDGYAEWADLIAAVFAAVHKGMGVDGQTPDARTVEGNLRAVVKSHEDRFAPTGYSTDAAGREHQSAGRPDGGQFVGKGGRAAAQRLLRDAADLSAIGPREIARAQDEAGGPLKALRRAAALHDLVSRTAVLAIRIRAKRAELAPEESEVVERAAIHMEARRSEAEAALARHTLAYAAALPDARPVADPKAAGRTVVVDLADFPESLRPAVESLVAKTGHVGALALGSLRLVARPTGELARVWSAVNEGVGLGGERASEQLEELWGASKAPVQFAVADVPDRARGHSATDAENESDAADVVRYKRLSRELLLRYDPIQSDFGIVSRSEAPELIGVPEWAQSDAGEPPPTSGYEAAHAPAGGVSVQGKAYRGGEFIPGAVMEKATEAEREAVRGGDGSDRPKADAGGRAATGSDAQRREKNRSRVAARPPTKTVRGIGRVVDIARSRRIKAAHKREKELADAVGGFNLLDSEPADVAHMPEVDGRGQRTGRPLAFGSQRELRRVLAARAAMVERMKSPQTSPDDREGIRRVLEEIQPLTFVEVKTLLTSKRDQINMSADARRKKEDWRDRYHAPFVLVIVDDRRGGKFSGHRVYVNADEQGLWATHKLADARKVDSMGDVLSPA